MRYIVVLRSWTTACATLVILWRAWEFQTPPLFAHARDNAVHWASYYIGLLHCAFTSAWVRYRNFGKGEGVRVHDHHRVYRFLETVSHDFLVQLCLTSNKRIMEHEIITLVTCSEKHVPYVNSKPNVLLSLVQFIVSTQPYLAVR